MTKYSGRTRAYQHLWAEKNAEKAGQTLEEWLKEHAGEGEDCIQQPTVLVCTWTNLPIELMEDVRRLWTDRELGNDVYYTPFHVLENEEEYPLIAEYLKSRNIEECLVHYWW